VVVRTPAPHSAAARHTVMIALRQGNVEVSTAEVDLSAQPREGSVVHEREGCLL
jgi:hypothetical protein